MRTKTIHVFIVCHPRWHKMRSSSTTNDKCQRCVRTTYNGIILYKCLRRWLRYDGWDRAIGRGYRATGQVYSRQVCTQHQRATWRQYRKIILCTFVAGYERPAVNNNNNNMITEFLWRIRTDDGRRFLSARLKWKRWYDFWNCIAIRLHTGEHVCVCMCECGLGCCAWNEWKQLHQNK